MCWYTTLSVSAETRGIFFHSRVISFCWQQTAHTFFQTFILGNFRFGTEVPAHPSITV